jgi:hypothetical protein
VFRDNSTPYFFLVDNLVKILAVISVILVETDIFSMDEGQNPSPDAKKYSLKN